ncbi:MAG: hypothetical protein DDT18_01342 [Actinobacteria bacterium]|nr:hypothetical protein [Actinomycetota bacterium]
MHLQESDGFGTVLVSSQSVTHIDDRPHVRPVHRVQKKDGFTHRAHKAVGAGLFNLVLYPQANIRIMIGHLFKI